MDSVSVALRAIAVQRWMSIAALASILVVPVVLGEVARRTTRLARPWQKAAGVLAAIAASLFYAGIALVFAVCWGGEIGESGKNRLARAYGTPIVAALSDYYAKTGRYPAQLVELVPANLTLADLRAPEEGPLRYPFEYARDSSLFQLTVRYVGPGMNTCTYAPGRSWRCRGYF